MEDEGGCGANAWLPGNTCVYVDVMLGRSCSSMLQNDLLLIERERKSEERKEREQERRQSGKTGRFTGLDEKGESRRRRQRWMDREKDR